MVIKLKKKEKNSKGEMCGWAVKSHTTNKILGKFKTKEKAEKWLKQIERFKYMKKNGILKETFDIPTQDYALYKRKNKKQNNIKFHSDINIGKQILNIKNNKNLTEEEKEIEINILKAKKTLK